MTVTRQKAVENFHTARPKRSRQISVRCQIHKWHHYFDIYEKYLSRFIGKNPTILEIGVKDGGSLELWDNYFVNKCKIYGVDINKKCKELEKNFNKLSYFKLR